MKKLQLAFVACFILFGAHAQTITEDTLLGDWNLRKIAQMGNIADLKTGEVQVSDEFAAQKGQTKENLAAQFKKKVGTMNGTLAFMPGKKMTFQVPGTPAANGTYTITEAKGKQYLTDEYTGSKMEIYFKDGLLYWELLTNDGIVTMAWEKVGEK
jgi:hypothetical protein